MPHLIFATRLYRGGDSVVRFFGPIEQEATEALARSTNIGGKAQWRQPSTDNPMTFFVDIPGTWECRCILGNVLRVGWLDVLEQYGWTVRAACNSEKPELLIKGIETDLVIPVTPVEDPPFDGECANFLLFKGAEGPEVDFLAAVSAVAACHTPLEVHSRSPSSASQSMHRAMESSTPRAGGAMRGSGASDRSSSKHGVGLTLPEVVQQLLKDTQALRWDSVHKHFEVMDGALFEKKFNELRKTRQKIKNGAVERPFSRMHNFFVLERGDKWAKTGTIFRPKDERNSPKNEDHSDGSAPEGKLLEGLLAAESAIRALEAMREATSRPTP